MIDIKEKQEYLFKIVKEYCEKHGFELITDKSEMFNNQSYVSYICPIHGEYTTKITNIKQNKICYKCSRQVALKKKWDHGREECLDDAYKDSLRLCSEKGYTLLTKREEFKVKNTRLHYICPKHGEKEITYENLAWGKGCKECGTEQKKRNLKLSKEEVISRVKKAYGVLLNPDDYINQTTKNLKILCPECQKPFITSLINFTQHGSQVCDDCHSVKSLGEKRIEKFLNEHKINYEMNKWFSDCRDINPLPFDFYLTGTNKIIEYDGEQHFRDISNPSFKYIFEKNKLHDQIKSDYCKNNNYDLLRIPYTEFTNIETILTNYLQI